MIMDLLYPFPMYLTFGFSAGRYLDVSLLLVTSPNLCPSSIRVLSETTISLFVYTRTKVQFSRRNIIYNVHDYLNL
jgi:hypothetical protein